MFEQHKNFYFYSLSGRKGREKFSESFFKLFAIPLSEFERYVFDQR